MNIINDNSVAKKQKSLKKFLLQLLATKGVTLITKVSLMNQAFLRVITINYCVNILMIY